MYDIQEGMLVTMDLGDPDIDQDNMDIWVLVDTPPVLPLCEFLKHSYYLIYIVYFKIVDSLFPLTAYFLFKQCAEHGRQNPLHRWLRVNLSGQKSSGRILY